MTDTPSPKDKLLDAAEHLFTLHGYASVRLRDLEKATGVHHATFYHHAPGGKAQLFAEAMERSLARHETALNARMRQHDGNLEAQLYAAAQWVLTNPAGNHTRMLTTDLPHLPPEIGTRLAQRAYRSLIGPLAAALRAARQEERAVFEDDTAEVIAGSLLAALQALQAAHERYPDPTPLLSRARQLIDVLLNGLRPRPEA